MKNDSARSRPLFVGLLVVFVSFAVLVPNVMAGDLPADTAHAVAADAQGMVIHVDPQTGAILKHPAPGSVPLQLSSRDVNALSTSHQGLVETPSSIPGKGIKLDLQGRFQSPLIATIDANGRVRMQHLDETLGGVGKP